MQAERCHIQESRRKNGWPASSHQSEVRLKERKVGGQDAEGKKGQKADSLPQLKDKGCVLVLQVAVRHTCKLSADAVAMTCQIPPAEMLMTWAGNFPKI